MIQRCARLVGTPQPAKRAVFNLFHFCGVRSAQRADPTARQQGMMLIECLVYLALLVVVLDLAFAAYHRCAENSKCLNNNVDDVVRALQAGERWRDDIRAATAIEPSEDSLRLVQSNATVDYMFDGNAVWRRAKAGAPLARFLTAVKSSRMETDARREVTAWRWKVELLTRGAPERFRPFFTFEAVPLGTQTK
jgi:Tfp pilus assembly protein PilE